jgi:carboxyl-terminal processing protease
VIIGRNTFGKGLVQNTRGLPYGTQMKMTIAKYYIPSNRCIQLLDYSHRNPDGSAGIIPDSLRKLFKTKNGRKVMDGGGVRPDRVVAENKLSNISQYLEKNYLIFDYATQYRNRYEKINTDARSFKLSDDDFKDFGKFILAQNFNYQTNSEIILNQLITKSKEEKYYEDLQKELEVLEKELRKIKTDDLEKSKNEILTLLQSEIVRRYYYEDAKVESSFGTDPDVLKALDVFNDLSQYQSILTNN